MRLLLANPTSASAVAATRHPRQVRLLGEVALPKGTIRDDRVAVLFADIVGYTRLAESVPPEVAIDILQRFHARMAVVVEAHDGQVVQFVGDTIMAAFRGPRPASNALACAYVMLATLARWNAKRLARGRVPVRIGIGLHAGAVAVGEIGGGNHIEHAVIGDTVNVARRLEAMTRTMGTPLLASDEIIGAIPREGGAAALTDGLCHKGLRDVPGRSGKIPVWALR